jgi:hypothetical protein
MNEQEFKQIKDANEASVFPDSTIRKLCDEITRLRAEVGPAKPEALSCCQKTEDAFFGHVHSCKNCKQVTNQKNWEPSELCKEGQRLSFIYLEHLYGKTTHKGIKLNDLKRRQLSEKL